MQITDEDVEEFMRLCLEERGIDLQPDEARVAVRRVLTLFETFATWLAKERGAEGASVMRSGISWAMNVRG